MDLDASKYFLETAELIEETSPEPVYPSAVTDDLAPSTPDDALEDIVTAFKEQEAYQKAQERLEQLRKTESLHYSPPRVDEYFRSFLLRNNFTDTLNAFQIEWFKNLHKGLLDVDKLECIPDIYKQNELLSDKILRLKYETEVLTAKVEEDDELIKKLKNERDYHILKHRRLIQEKDQLINEVKRIRSHYAEYEPILRQLQHKYEVAMKEKTLNRVERDRAIGQAEGLRTALASLQQLGIVTDDQNGLVEPESRTGRELSERKGDAPQQVPTEDLACATRSTHMRKTLSGGLVELPADRKVNPMLSRLKPGSADLSRLANRKLNENIHAHKSPCTSVTVHTEQPWLCTTGDDHSWKLWSTSKLAILAEQSDAHSSWIASADFHPKEPILATAGGDGNIRIWQFKPPSSEPPQVESDKTTDIPTVSSKQSGYIKRLSELKHHTGAAWSVNWHWDGRFLASAGMDQTVCLWDASVESREQKSVKASCITLRKHCGSVNSVRFLPFGNIMVTASTDRTVLLWDARTAINVHSFLGHQSSVSHAVFNQQGTYIASCDSKGVVRFWDLRQASSYKPVPDAEASSFVCAASILDLAKTRKKRLQLSVNQVAYDLSGDYVAAACSDGRVCYVEVSTSQVSSLYAHEDAVQSVAFDLKSEQLYSTSSDGRLCSWN